MSIKILGIESSCDETSAAVVCDGVVFSNIIAGQEVHREYGGVVPELASRAHQQNIVPVVDTALKRAKIKATELDAIAFTRGPGLLGALLVGTSFSKGMAISLNIPLVEVNHLQAHVLSHFLQEPGIVPPLPVFPFLCLLVSGGHTQLIVVKDYLDMKIIGQTIDDAAGEAFDKCAKVMGLPYPGGPLIDNLAKSGNERAYQFSKPKIQGLDYSFSGLKTSFLYFIRDAVKRDPGFVTANLNDLCASIQKTVVDILMEKLISASKETGINEVGISGGVSANSYLRKVLIKQSQKLGWNYFYPELRYTTDNAAMIALTGYYKFMRKEYTGHDVVPMARFTLGMV